MFLVWLLGVVVNCLVLLIIFVGVLGVILIVKVISYFYFNVMKEELCVLWIKIDLLWLM